MFSLWELPAALNSGGSVANNFMQKDIWGFLFVFPALAACLNAFIYWMPLKPSTQVTKKTNHNVFFDSQLNTVLRTNSLILLFLRMDSAVGSFY